MAFAPEVKKRIERALAGTKRRVLVDEPEARFLVYRIGGSGDSAYDFLLDVKMAAEPFNCSQAAASWITRSWSSSGARARS